MRAALFFLFEEFINAAQVLAHTTVAEFIYLGDESVKKVAVMADGDERTVEVPQRLLEYILCFQVEMVGRLVEYKQVDRLKEELYHAQPHALSTRQHFDLFLIFLTAEHERPRQIQMDLSVLRECSIFVL